MDSWISRGESRARINLATWGMNGAEKRCILMVDGRECGDLFPFYWQRITVYWFQSPVDRWIPIDPPTTDAHDEHRWITSQWRPAALRYQFILDLFPPQRPETWCSVPRVDKWIIFVGAALFAFKWQIICSMYPPNLTNFLSTHTDRHSF